MQNYESSEQLILISKLFEAKAKKYVLETQEFPQAIEYTKTVLLEIEAYWQEFENFAVCEQSHLKLLQILELLIAEIQDQLMLLCQTVAHVITTQLKIQHHYDLAQKAANYCQQKAQLEWQVGNENLAKQTLLRRKTYLETANILRLSLEQQTPQLKSLQTHLLVMQNWLSLAQQMKDTLVRERHDKRAGISSSDCWFFNTGNQPQCFVSNRLQLSGKNQLSRVNP